MSAVDILRHLEALSARLDGWQSQGLSVGVVPTMGALHEGHLSLVRASLAATDRTITTIFVNPLQFGPNEDFGSYPRQQDEDVAKLKALGCQAAFLPEESDFFGEEFSTVVSVPTLSQFLCGVTRPNFFQGITSELCRLFNFLPGTTVFMGEKDFQQYRVVEKMVRDLRLPVSLSLAPTVRDATGL